MAERMREGRGGGFPNASVPFVDTKTGRLTNAGYRLLEMLFDRTGGPDDLVFQEETIARENEARIDDLRQDQDQARADLAQLEGLSVGDMFQRLADDIDRLSAGQDQAAPFAYEAERVPDLEDLKQQFDGLEALVVLLQALLTPEALAREVAVLVEAVVDADFSTNGICVRIAPGSYANRTLTGPAAGISVSNGDGVSGNPSLALANDLAGLEGQSGTGLVTRTGDGTYAQRSVAAGTGVSVADGDGVAGNPTVSIPQSVATTATPQFNGIQFPATQVPSADANLLDDYEEGTFTPGLTFGGGSTGLTHSAGYPFGVYIKIGRYVHVSVAELLTAKGSSTGSALLTGLPFTVASANAGDYAALSFSYQNLTGLTLSPALQANIGTTTANFYDGSTALTHANFPDTSNFYVSGGYRASA